MRADVQPLISTVDAVPRTTNIHYICIPFRFSHKPIAIITILSLRKTNATCSHSQTTVIWPKKPINRWRQMKQPFAQNLFLLCYYRLAVSLPGGLNGFGNVTGERNVKSNKPQNKRKKWLFTNRHFHIQMWQAEHQMENPFNRNKSGSYTHIDYCSQMKRVFFSI